MVLKKFIENVMYVGLYIVALLLFFVCGGNTGNFWVLLGAAHLLSILGIIINAEKEVTVFFLKSLSVYTLISNFLVLSGYSCVWLIMLFFAMGLVHIFMIEDEDLFGILAVGKKEHELVGLKLLLWLMISVMVTLIYVVV